MIEIRIDGPDAETVRSQMAMLLGDPRHVVMLPAAQPIYDEGGPLTAEAAPLTMSGKGSAVFAETATAAAVPVAELPKKRGRRTKAEIEAEKRQISASPENRAGPEDSPADQAQDAADEQTESAAAKAANGGKLTHDDVRRAVGEYSDRYGFEAAVSDIGNILGCAITEVPDNQEALWKAVFAVKLAIEKNPYKHGATTQEPATTAPAAPTATLEEAKAALFAYAAKYDGTDDPEKMTFTQQDGPKIFAGEFGANVTKLSQIAQEPAAYGRAVTAIRKAIETNPFGRPVAL